jgi:tryptophanyl-tRNA synthetase
MKIVTDSLPPEAPKDTKSSNIFLMYKYFASPEQISNLEVLYKKGIGWGEAKQHLFEVIHNHFKAPTEKFNQMIADKSELDRILEEGSVRAREVATPFMEKIRKAVRG